MIARERDWISAHIFYEGDLDPLIVGLVGPLTDELVARGWARRFFFLRYWDGGPHLRVRVLPAQPERAVEVTRHVEDRVGAFLREQPSGSRLSEADYQRSARELGAWEKVRPIGSRYPNNTVAFIPYVRETGRYGTGERIEAVEKHFHDSSRLALETLSRGLPVAQRETQALALILLSERVLRERGLRHEPANTAAWARLLARTGTGDAQALDRSYQRQSGQLAVLAEQMGRVVRHVAALPGQSTFARWVRSLDPLLSPALSDGGLDPASVVDLCTHLMCNRLGVRLEVEGSLRLLAARTLTDAAAAGAAATA